MHNLNFPSCHKAKLNNSAHHLYAALKTSLGQNFNVDDLINNLVRITTVLKPVRRT